MYMMGNRILNEMFFKCKINYSKCYNVHRYVQTLITYHNENRHKPRQRQELKECQQTAVSLHPNSGMELELLSAQKHYKTIFITGAHFISNKNKSRSCITVTQ